MFALIFLCAFFTWFVTIIAGFGLGKDMKGNGINFLVLLSILLMTLTLWLSMNFN